jgi:hypothetical protein
LIREFLKFQEQKNLALNLRFARQPEWLSELASPGDDLTVSYASSDANASLSLPAPATPYDLNDRSLIYLEIDTGNNVEVVEGHDHNLNPIRLDFDSRK